MIHWGWLVAALCAGVAAGMFIGGICATADSGGADERLEAMREQIKKEGYHV